MAMKLSKNIQCKTPFYQPKTIIQKCTFLIQYEAIETLPNSTKIMGNLQAKTKNNQYFFSS